jgi:DNA recombination protein RmuC
MSNTILLVAVVLGFLGLATLLVTQLKRLTPPPPAPSIDPQALLMLQQRLEAVSQEFRQSLGEQTRQQQSSSFHMTSTVRDVTERLVKIEETNKQILSFSGQLENLQRILSNPKQRGILGEYYLETLLKNVFSPDQFQMQYRFKDGEIVDAVVFVKNQIIPIDSKFSLENYNRLVEETKPEERARLEKLFLNDLKERIKETSKYIRPDEGTMDFAFMFIPHEAIYYDLLVNKIGTVTAETENILQVAAGKYHVICVSPTSFSAYLQTVLQGLRALKIEEQTKEIQKRVTDLQKHLQNFEQHFGSVGRNLSTVVNQYNLATKDFSLIDKDVLRISGQGMGYQPGFVDKPQDADAA